MRFLIKSYPVMLETNRIEQSLDIDKEITELSKWPTF